MLSRTEFYSLQEKLEKENISIWEIAKESDKAIDFLNVIEISEDSYQRMEWIIKAEDLIKNVFNRVMVKLNPYANELISWDDKIQNTYKNFKFRMENFIKGMETKKQQIIDKMSLKNTDESTERSNKINLDSLSNFFSSILRELILNVLDAAYMRYISLEAPYFKSQDEDGKKVIFYDLKNLVKKGDERIFWYYVYFYLAELSQVNVSLFTLDKFQIRPLDLADMNKFSGGAFGVEKHLPENYPKEGKTSESDDAGKDNKNKEGDEE